jgi:predicted HicB family RNase H-like nuclease
VSEAETTSHQEEILRAARNLFAGDPDWVSFFRQILGVHGAVRRHYQTRQALAEFEQTDAYAEVQQMLRALRERATVPPAEDEPTRVITVRLPKSLHEALRAEAHEHQTSINKLCISKLLQFIDNNLVPTEH